MSTETMGKVLVSATLENLADVYGARRDALIVDQVRKVTVTDALVDLTVSGLLIPSRLNAVLGLGLTKVLRTVQLTVQGRDFICDAKEIGDHLPVVIGRIPLTLMDWVVDVEGQQLIGNPEHGGEQMMEALSVYN
jgi:hypothetical protein